MADSPILTPPLTEEVPPPETAAADDGSGGISNDLLNSGMDKKSLAQALMLAKVIKAALASQDGGAGKSPFTTQLDSFYGLQPGGAFRNQEYAPSSTGIKHLFLGGSPYPVSSQQEDAAKKYAQLSMVSNILDVAGGALRNRNEQRQTQGQGVDIAAILKMLGIGG